jgi:hypothetical protein
MQDSRDETSKPNREVEVEGLPVVRPNVAGIDLGSERHWACAPRVDGGGREVEQFGATTPELERMVKWLKERKVESVAMESTGVYWIAPQRSVRAARPGSGTGEYSRVEPSAGTQED